MPQNCEQMTQVPILPAVLGSGPPGGGIRGPDGTSVVVVVLGGAGGTGGGAGGATGGVVGGGGGVGGGVGGGLGGLGSGGLFGNCGGF